MEASGVRQRRAGRVWREETPPRPILIDDSTFAGLKEEIGWIQTTLVEIINRVARVETICIRSKRR